MRRPYKDIEASELSYIGIVAALRDRKAPRLAQAVEDMYERGRKAGLEEALAIDLDIEIDLSNSRKAYCETVEAYQNAIQFLISKPQDGE